ncbi:MAG: hypothetical protein KAI43_00880 [Candidatus Aureabacteria bacterium]|nr:hypothetical protein [Candidatus Auribacterota bacterium]
MVKRLFFDILPDIVLLHGGKDVTPYPVDQTYIKTIDVLKRAVKKIKPDDAKDQELLIGFISLCRIKKDLNYF